MRRRHPLVDALAVETGLPEAEAQFGGGLEDGFAVGLGVGGIVEGEALMGDVTPAAGELSDASAEGLGRGSWGGGLRGGADRRHQGPWDWPKTTAAVRLHHLCQSQGAGLPVF